MLHPDTIDAAIFDMDGLMLDTEPIYRLAWTRAIAAVGYSFEERLYAQFVGRSNDDCDRLTLELFGPDFPIDRCRLLRDECWRYQIANQGIPLRPGLVELLDLLDDLCLPRAIATASVRGEAELSLAAANIGDRFHSLTTGDDVVQNKPAPDIYLEAARKMGVEPNRCLVFEDSNAGAIAAITAGTLTIVVPDLQQPTDRLVSLAYAILPSLHDARDAIAAAWA